ncbi:hypothetical protein GVN16_24230 [Emticicia sp. CRIBPO]|uniref:NACHT domain-containing protein n=1 Tax=Emticicia sp. CRIBPO TaxID=2683258 RepID=UPI0014127DDE|nr:hypothetical protein [Emticicia sp. CRIBPO]NBA88905.1 hypothetical protein [Emticicia sp. CRIBPO]
MEKIELEKIYKTYGFEVDNSNINVPVFLYKKGRYFGADIIPLKNDPETISNAENIKNIYSEAGFATTIKNLTCLEEAENELFKSFFSYDATLERLRKKHKEFEKKQTHNLFGNQYKYITCPYEIYENEPSGNSFISNILYNILNFQGPHLTIIEAAAGYGKTSTAFELLREMVKDNSMNKIPIITELSRNRDAKIFRYILLDEIDNEFQTLNSNLVIKEINEGRIPVIIDGFDELLSKISLDSDISNLEEVEPMLNTIGNLLQKNAKIILTTRKTAIFNGPEFDKWKSRWKNSFEVLRISIKEPRIIDWLGEERCELLEKHNIHLDAISNPVILSFLKNISLKDFENEISSSENLVNNYFEKMLERERERQNLLMTPQNQFEVFKNVVKLLIELDTKLESKEFFKEMIKEQNSKLLEQIRLLYLEKPTLESLVDTLATHALLDRKGREGNEIGFINDFVFGIFIGEIIIEQGLINDSLCPSVYMIELAVTAFKVHSPLMKNELWSRIQEVEGKFTLYSLFNFDLILQNSLKRDYNSLDVKETTFYNVRFEGFRIEDTVFINCIFKKCLFNNEIFKNVTFINCEFNACNTSEDFLDRFYVNANVIGCREINSNILIETVYQDDFVQDDNIETQLIILQYMWNFAQLKKHLISGLIRMIDGKSVKAITNSINELVLKNLISVRGNHIEFNMNKINEIRNLVNDYERQ